MWIFIKLFAAVVGFIIRFISRKCSPILRGYSEEGEGKRQWLLKVHTSDRRVYGTTFAVPVAIHSVFKLTQEGFWDRWFKSWGLAQEAQAGDRSFDDRVYIACDSPAFNKRVAQDKNLRTQVIALFDQGAKEIVSDGTLLRAYFEGDRSESDKLPDALLELSQTLTQAEKVSYHLFQDPFVVRALIAEALVWSLATYAILGALEWGAIKADLHLDSYAILRLGLAVGFFGAVAAFILVFLFMRGSSRGHRIMVESAVILALCLPLGGMHIVSDINTGLDSSPPEVVLREVANKRKKEHRGRRGRRYYTYHIYLKEGPEPSTINAIIPLHIQVASSLFSEAEPGRQLRIELGHGFLHIPWYRSLSVEGW